MLRIDDTDFFDASTSIVIGQGRRSARDTQQPDNFHRRPSKVALILRLQGVTIKIVMHTNIGCTTWAPHRT